MDSMDHRQLYELIRRYNAGQCSKEEQVWVEQWYLSFEWNSGVGSTEQVDLQKEWESFTRQVGTGVQNDQGIASVMRLRSSIKRWSAAAAVLVVLSAGAYFLIGRDHRQKVAKVLNEAQLRNDVAPGGNKAILTLSGGRRLILDSAARDTVLTEGSDIVANAGGRLAYNEGSKPGTETVYNTLTTPRGGQYQLTLPDGTRVWLNAASSITYPIAFSGPERKVTITGEAYLEVAQNARQPFKVVVGGIDINVLGTSFNVNAYPDEADINTTLLEGKVQITNKNQKVILEPGQQAQVSGSESNIRVLSGVDVEQAIAWKNGFFAFTKADLPTVIRQLARWYDVEVHYEGDIPKREFNGEIGKLLTLDQVLKVLTKTRVHYTIEGNQLTIWP
jgi:ferric-dicitrate binding protein FerR (iron transport regulator)